MNGFEKERFLVGICLLGLVLSGMFLYTITRPVNIEISGEMNEALQLICKDKEDCKYNEIPAGKIDIKITVPVFIILFLD